MEAVAAMAGEPWTHRPRCASPVLTDWFLAWNDILADDARQDLVAYVEPLTRSRGSTDQEVERQWMVLDWVTARAVPTCLIATGLTAQADLLARLEPVRSQRQLAAVAPLAEAAAHAARDTHEAGWRSVAELAQPDAPQNRNRPPWRPTAGYADPRRVATWGALAEGTRAAIGATSSALQPASSALRYDVNDTGRLPATWTALVSAFTDAAGAVGWAGTRHEVTTSAWSWTAPPEDAWRAGWAAAHAALRPLNTHLVASAHDLVARLMGVDGR